MNDAEVLEASFKATVYGEEYYAWTDLSRDLFFIKPKGEKTRPWDSREITMRDDGNVIISRATSCMAMSLDFIGGVPSTKKLVVLIEAFFGEGKHEVSQETWKYITDAE